ncbi:MAG: primase-helicase family protein [Brucella sp.]
MASIILNENECLEQFNQKHWVVLHGSRVVITHQEYDPTVGRTRTVFLKPDDFRKLYANVFVNGPRLREPLPAAEWWLQHKDRKQGKGVVFDPKEETHGYFNLWKGFSVAPKDKDCKRILDFIREVICDGDEEQYCFFIGYFAHMVQRPSELPETALILVGEQGTGKSFVIKQFARLIAEHTNTISKRQHLVGSFNAHMAHTILLIADEVSIATRFATNALKAPITEPTLMLEAKGHDAVPIRNCIRYVLLTNDPHVVLMGPNERRFAVYEVSNQKQQDHKFFAELSSYMDNGGLEGLMHHLQGFDLSQFNIRKVPPSKGRAHQIEQSFSDIERYWYECLLVGELPLGEPWNQELEKGHLTRDYRIFCDEVGQSKRSAETMLFRNLRKMCPSIRDYRPANGKRHIVFPTLQEARKAFDARTGITWEWPN